MSQTACSYGRCKSNLIRNFQTDYKGDYINFHYSQQCVKVTVAPLSGQNLVLSIFFLISATLEGRISLWFYFVFPWQHMISRTFWCAFWPFCLKCLFKSFDHFLLDCLLYYYWVIRVLLYSKEQSFVKYMYYICIISQSIICLMI